MQQGSVSSVKVGVRVRPLLSKERNQPVTISVNDSTSLQFKNSMGFNNDVTYTFDHVFGSELSQEDLYKETAAPMLKSFLEGYNVTIMAYGQTGSGKTYTMGTADIHTSNTDSCQNTKVDVNSQQGLIPRFVTDLFNNMEDNSSSHSMSYKVKISFLEIYGEDVFDLIPSNSTSIGSMGMHSPQPSSHRNDRISLAVREDENAKVFVQGQNEVEVSSADAVMELLSTGSRNRVTASTAMNAGSSRSHAVFTVSLEQQTRPDPNLASDDQAIAVSTVSKLTFVDLAGSERIKRTGAEGQRLKEGIQINSGLFNLGQVINSLADDQRLKSGAAKNVHVPYRNSKLTHLLKDALGGNSQTLFLACVSPADCNESETQSTLNYAKQARNIQNKPVKNLDKNQLEIRRLRLTAKAWMTRALSLMFEASNSAQSNILPPHWAMGEGDEERLLSRPEVARYVEAVNQTIAESLGGLGPTPRKIRLSSGFPGWSPCISPVRNASNPTTTSKSRLHRPNPNPPRLNPMDIVDKLKPMLSSSGDYLAASLSAISSSEETEHESLLAESESLSASGLCTEQLSNTAGSNSISLDVDDKQDKMIERMLEMLGKERESLSMTAQSLSESRNADDVEDANSSCHPQTAAELTAEVDLAILEKEELLSKLMETVRNYANIKNEFEKLLDAINDLEEEKKALEAELERAKKAISAENGSNATSTATSRSTASSIALEQLKERFQKVKDELRLMREERKKKESTYKMVQRGTKQCDSIQKELQKLKQSKVLLLKQQRQQTMQLLKLKKEQAQKMQLSKKSDIRKQQQLNTLKSELLKKDRVLGHRNKEIGRVCAKLRACEEHIAQLLKIQNRNRLKSCNNLSNQNMNDYSAAGLVGVAQLDRKGLASFQAMGDADHFSSSKNMLNNIIIDKVERSQLRILYSRKTRSLQRLNQELLKEACELEELLAEKRNLLSEGLRSSSAQPSLHPSLMRDGDTEGVSMEDVLDFEADLIKRNVFSEGDLIKLRQINSSIQLVETNVERLTSIVDTHNADLDELSLKMEYQNSGKMFSPEDSSSCDKDNAQLWDIMGRDIVASLSVGQSQSLLWEMINEKAALLEQLRLNQDELSEARWDCEMNLDRLKDSLFQLTMLKDEMQSRLEEAEKKRINDVWLACKTSIDLPANAAVIEAKTDIEAELEAKTAGNANDSKSHLVLLSVTAKKTKEIEMELERALCNEQHLLEEEEERKKLIHSLEEEVSALQMKLRLSKDVNGTSSENSENDLLHLDDSKSTATDNVIKSLCTIWAELGLPQTDREEAADYIQSSRTRTLQRVLGDAESLLSATKKDVSDMEQRLFTLCSILGKTPQEMHSQAGVEYGDLPLMSRNKQLQKAINVAEEKMLRQLPRVFSAKDRLLDVVAEMWLDISDIHPALQQLLRLKINVPKQQNDDRSDSPGPEWDSNYVMEELMKAKINLPDLDGVVETEIRKLNLQRVQTTMKLIEARSETIRLMEELEIKQVPEVDHLFQTFRTPSDLPMDPSEDIISTEVMKAAAHLVVVNSSSNPPGSQKLLFALQRLRLVLESVKVNRSTLFDLLSRFLYLCQSHLSVSREQTPSILPLEDNCKYGKSQLDRLLIAVESIDMELSQALKSSEAQLATTISEICPNDSKDADAEIASKIGAYKSSCHEEFCSGEAVSLLFDRIRGFETNIEELTCDLNEMAAFVEEQWLKDRVAEICRRWSGDSDGLRVIAREVLYVTSEEARLSQLLDAFKELLRTDAQLQKHTAELEEFEHSSKQDRAKALTGNSKLLIEEEKFRKMGKKKFEHISEKLLQSFNRMQQLSPTAPMAGSVASSQNQPGPMIDIKPDLEPLSAQSRSLIKGKLKERAELMHLELMPSSKPSASAGSGRQSASIASTASSSSSSSVVSIMSSPDLVNNPKMAAAKGSKANKHANNQHQPIDENIATSDTTNSNLSLPAPYQQLPQQRCSAEDVPKNRVRIVL